MSLAKNKVVCLLLIIFFSVLVSTATFAVDKGDLRLIEKANLQPKRSSPQMEEEDDAPTGENMLKAKQAGDLEKAARIQAVLEEKAKRSWGRPADDQTFIEYSYPRPPLRGANAHKSLTWGNDVQITGGPVEGGISLASDTSGSLYAVRCSTWNDSAHACINVYKSTDAGESWSSVDKFATWPGSYSHPVILTERPSSRLYVLYLNSYHDGDIRMACHAQGGLWESFHDVKADADTITYFSACTDLGKGDHLMVVYQKEEMGDNTPDLYSVVSTDQGENWSTEVKITENGSHPDIAYGNDGYVYCVHEKTGGTDKEIAFIRSSDYGASWELGTGEYLTWDSYDNSYPKVAALHTLPADGAHVWVAYNHDWSTAKGDDTLEYHGTVAYFWCCPDSYGDDMFSVRFTPAWGYTLKSAQLMFYQSGSTGSNGVRVYVWNSDGQLPTTKVDSVDIDYGCIQWYPTWTTVDFSSKNITLSPVSDFHIGYRSLCNDTIAIISDEGEDPAGSECRTSEHWSGGWGTMCDDHGWGYNFFIRAVVEPAGTGIGLRYAYSTNSGVDWSKDHILADDPDYDVIACDLWVKPDETYNWINICYLEYGWIFVPPYTYIEVSNVYRGYTQPLYPTSWDPTRISDHRAAMSEDGREVCQGAYTGNQVCVFYAGKPYPGNFENLYFDNGAWTDAEDEVRGEEATPEFSLSANYPNPFNPVTRIQYTVGTQKAVHGSQFMVPSPVHTTLKIYNVLGQLVRTLVDKQQEAGTYEVIWNGKDENANEVSSGIYFYRLKAGDFVEARKMLLLK